MRYFFLKRWGREIKHTLRLLYSIIRDYIFGEVRL